MQTKIGFRGALMLLALIAAARWRGYSRQPGRALAANSPQVVTGTPDQEAKRALTIEERADLHMARKEYGDAVDSYAQALRRSGLSADDTASLWNRIGIAYQAGLRFRAARKGYTNSVHIRKDFAKPWSNIGTTYSIQKKYGKCEKW